MKTMLSLTIWYMWRSFINALKRHWKLFLGIILFVGIIVGVAYFVADNEKRQETEPPVHQTSVTTFGDITIIDNYDNLTFVENGKEYKLVGTFLFEAIALFVILVLVAVGIKGGAKNGVNIFSMADVNFVFPSPNRPQNVLLFRMISQIGVALIGSIYILFQCPQYISDGYLSIPATIIILVCYVFVTVAANYFGIFTYLILANKPKIRNIVNKFIMYVLLVPVLIVVIMKYVFGMGLVESVYEVVEGTTSRMIPFFGWLRYSLVLAVQRDYVMSVVFLLLSVGFILAMIWFAWRIEADFYEDSLTFAAMQQEVIQKLDDKNKGQLESSKKHTRKFDEKKWNKRRNKELIFKGFDGGRVFFAKSVLNRRRMCLLGGLLSSEFISALLYGIALIAASHFLFDNSMNLDNTMNSVSIMVIYLLIIVVGIFTKSFSNPLKLDLNVNFMYMIPERPASILGWNVLGYMLNGVIDYIPTLFVAFYFSKDILIALICYFSIIVLYIYFGMMALLIEIVIKSYLPKYLSIVIQAILKLLPLGLTVLICYFGIKSGTITYIMTPFIIFIVAYILMAILAFWPCTACLHKGRK